MNVASILALKGNHVYTVRPEQTLQEASAELSRLGIGALAVVEADGVVAGMVTEREILAAIASGETSSLSDPVSAHMRKGPCIAAKSDAIYSVMEKMTGERHGYLLVVEGGHLAGILSLGYIVKSLLAQIEAERRALHEYIASDRPPGPPDVD